MLKLVPNAFDKEQHVLHYEETYIKTHRLLEFNQSQLLKVYVDFNTTKE